MPKREPIRMPLAFEAFFLPAACVYLELAFKASTTHAWGLLSTLVIALFALALGVLVYALALVPPKKTGGQRVVFVALVLLGVLFCIEYFVFREFKVFYDLTTVTAGAGDAATGFADQIFGLVFSPVGLGHIAAFAAPAALYKVCCIVTRNPEAKATAKHAAAPKTPQLGRRRPFFFGALALCVTAALAGRGLVAIVPTMASSYSERYDFQQVVANAGLVEGLRKEVVRFITHENEHVAFTAATGSDDVQASTSEASDTVSDGAQVSDAPKVYAEEAMDIDFEALAASATGTWHDLDEYVSSLTPSHENDMTGIFAGKNLIMISAEAFSAEAIREDTTPTLYRMANKGMQFTDYYQFDSAGTTGGECQNIFGLVPTEGGNSVKITAEHNNYFTMGNALNRLGYNGWAFHNNTYTYYSRHLTHVNLGYSNGYMGYGNGMEEWVTWQWPQSDLEMIQGTFENLYGDEEPFNVYYMSVSGHSGYWPAENAMSQKNWDVVENLEYSEPVRGYLAANVELDRAMEWLIAELEKRGIADDTVIVIGADHFPYGLDDDGPLGNMPYTSELYGYDVNTYFQRDHNRLIIWSGCLEDEEPIVVSEPTYSLDILPTLLNLFGCEWDSRLLPGRDVFSDAQVLVFDPSYDWRTDEGTYYASRGEFEPFEGHEVADDYVAQMNAVVANKMNYCRGVLQTDYFRHVFGDPEDVEAVNKRGKAENAELFGASNLHAAAGRVNAALSDQLELLNR